MSRQVLRVQNHHTFISSYRDFAPTCGLVQCASDRRFANVRSEPDPAAAVLAALARGTKVEVFEDPIGWDRIDPVESHWVKGSFLKGFASDAPNPSTPEEQLGLAGRVPIPGFAILSRHLDLRTLTMFPTRRLGYDWWKIGVVLGY